jgi:hypothetical protein
MAERKLLYATIPLPFSCSQRTHISLPSLLQLEFIYKRTPKNDQDPAKPRYLVRCVYVIAFVALGNLSGNALAFGTLIKIKVKIIVYLLIFIFIFLFFIESW